ncbi:MAG: NAD(P)-binding domain-containing protein, partial [Bacteroidota bacterium]|nr:NAD(P)-binding domain-containing protein [Bacteroidota bacterium]
MSSVFAVFMYFWSVISVSIIGTGNVAFHLAKALSTSQCAKLQFIAGRSITKLTDFKAFAQVSTQVSDTFHSDLIILAVSDNAIGE